MKARTGRCEGRKPYGASEGEQDIIARMKELRASGMAFDRIAATLNEEGVPTRTAGKRWHGFAVNQILTRSAIPKHPPPLLDQAQFREFSKIDKWGSNSQKLHLSFPRNWHVSERLGTFPPHPLVRCK